MAARDLEARAIICDIGRRLWQRGLIGGSEGNISLRLGSNRILCSPTGLCKGQMRPADIVLIDAEGRSLDGGRPSSEIKLHLRILAKLPECGAVVHAHPPIATGFSIAGRTIPDDVLPESAFILGSVALAPFAMPGTDEVPDGVEPLLAEHTTILLSHHGAVTHGKNLEQAYERMETLERVAHMLFVAEAMGGAKPMPAEAFRQISKGSL